MTSETGPGRKPVGAPLAALTLIAILLRFWALGAAPLFSEEKWTLAQAAGFSFADLPPVGAVIDSSHLTRWTSVREILHRIGAFDQPLFILLAHGATDAMGVSEWALRALPAIFGALSPLLLYYWASRLVGRSEALVAAAFLTFHPFHVALSRYARVYAIAIAVLLLGYLIPHRWKDRRVFSPTGLFLGAQPLTHMLSGFAAIPHLIQLRLLDRVRRRQILASACVGLVLLASALPFGLADSILSEHLYTGLAHRGTTGALALEPGAIAATGTLAVSTLFGLDLSPLGGRTRYAVPALAILMALTIRGARSIGGARRIVLVAGAVLPFLVTLGLCAFYGHLVPLLPRYSVWALPFLLVLLSVGVCRTAKPSVWVGLILASYLVIDVALIASTPSGMKLQAAARVAACSSKEAPMGVDDAVDAFIAAAAREDRVFFAVRRTPTGEPPSIPATAVCP